MRKGVAGLLIVLSVGVVAVAPCFYLDSPDCACFNNAATWNPSGSWIQDIALDTVGTIVSCVPHGGKPFYQMRLGLDSPGSATGIAMMLQAYGGITGMGDREAWCSETISYWHREAGIPYSAGYRGSTWLLDWQLTNTNAIRTFYMVEDFMRLMFPFIGGRGRWIDWSWLDYSDFRPGINAPAPGSYVLIRMYADSAGTWGGKSHSMMIDEMTIHQSTLGEIVRVEVTLLDGNAGTPAQVRSTASLDDLIAYTPGGSEWLSLRRKILGFGVDLDASGSPVYDPDRLHYVTDLFVPSTPPKPFAPFPTKDPLWEGTYAPLVKELVEFAAQTAGGPLVEGPGPVIGAGGIPDGNSVVWAFGPELDRTHRNGFTIEVDLLRNHPLPIEGIVLRWEGTTPTGYSVRYAADGESFHDVSPPGAESLRLASQLVAPIPIAIPFGEAGARIRTVQLRFPPGSFAGESKLTEMRFIYDWGQSDEAESNPDVPGTSEGGPLSLRLSATATPTPNADQSHILTVSWEISGGVAPYRLTIVVTGPDGSKTVESDQALTGTREVPLAYPGGGTVHVSAEVTDGLGSVVSGRVDASLGPSPAGIPHG